MTALRLQEETLGKVIDLIHSSEEADPELQALAVQWENTYFGEEVSTEDDQVFVPLESVER